MLALCASAIVCIAGNSIAASKADVAQFMASSGELNQKKYESIMDSKDSKEALSGIGNITELIDNSIDSTTYFIGGGDVFSIHIMELPSTEYSAVIDQNCDAAITELGLVRIGKKTLGEAKSAIQRYVKSRLKKEYTVYVSLTKVKTATVSVSGSVTAPGTYQVKGTSRLLDVLRKANENTLPVLSDCNYREVLCSRNGEPAVTYDLYQFIFKHDLSQNPYVYPGDNIALDYTQRSVYLNGSVTMNIEDIPSLKKQVPIKNGESIKDFLAVLPLEAGADSDNIIINKHSPDGSSHTIIFSMNKPDATLLENKDVVIISEKKNYPHVETIMLTGEVISPGMYPIIKDKTTVEDILKLSGGVTDYSDMSRAVVIRHLKSYVLKNTMQPTKASTPALNTNLLQLQQVLPPNFIRPEITTALMNSAATMDFTIMPIKDHAKDIVLELADEINIPKKETTVYVSGKVSNPGVYTYVDGKTRDYYVKKAGGFVRRADTRNISVISIYGNGSAYQINDKSAVMAGDIILVPESVQYKTFGMVFSPTLSYVLSAISLFLTGYVVIHR